MYIALNHGEFSKIKWDHNLIDGTPGLEYQAHADNYSMINGGVKRDIL